MRGQADAQSREKFEQAMAAGTKEAEEPSAQSYSPFALFGSMPTTLAPRIDTILADHLHEALNRLMVDDRAAGGKQVRMELKDDLLPGVTVAIQEAHGRLQVDFICAVESLRHRLNAALPKNAEQLAQSLRRDVLLRVQANDEDDPCLFEIAASASGQPPQGLTS
ncbi:MAG: hypothetical protein ABIR26_16405 [Ramlibacter sp.]